MLLILIFKKEKQVLTKLIEKQVWNPVVYFRNLNWSIQIGTHSQSQLKRGLPKIRISLLNLM